MDNNWAAEHLQTIRTLMERSALYRRALAPISTYVGVVGIVAAIVGLALNINAPGTAAVYWMSTGFIAVIGALLLVRRQAVKQGENFWSPPTRRIAQAMAPALFVGLVVGIVLTTRFFQENDERAFKVLIIIWTLFYGLALNAAGFFMPRGIRLFGWGFLTVGMASLIFPIFNALIHTDFSAHIFMGTVFGASHLAYGIYLYFTERKNEA